MGNYKNKNGVRPYILRKYKNGVRKPGAETSFFWKPGSRNPGQKPVSSNISDN